MRWNDVWGPNGSQTLPGLYRLPIHVAPLLDIGLHDIVDWGGGLEPRMAYLRPTPVTFVEVMFGGGGSNLWVVVRCDWNAENYSPYPGDPNPVLAGAIFSRLVARASPVIFTSSIFTLGAVGLQPNASDNWLAAEVTFSAALLPTAVSVYGTGGAVIATGTAAGNALAPGWDASRGTPFTRSYPIWFNGGLYGFKVYPR